MKLSNLIEQIKLKKSYLCVGIDPDLEKIPKQKNKKMAINLITCLWRDPD